jgi:hypothetical protein
MLAAATWLVDGKAWCGDECTRQPAGVNFETEERKPA